MIGLTPKQSECFSFIKAKVDETGIAPTVSEIAEHLRLASKSGVIRLLDALEDRGYIRRMEKRARAIEIVAPLCPHCHKPLAGQHHGKDAA